MADVRVRALRDLTQFEQAPENRLRSKLKLALRRFVAATSRSPLRHLYAAVYRAHIAYAVRVLKKLPGVKSIYLTGGIASGELRPGISDIDLTVNGEWSEEQQERVIATLERLGRLPLFDRASRQNCQTLDAFRRQYESDYFFQFRIADGRRRWKLLYGEDVFRDLPSIPEERLPGGYYMELRMVWSYFVKSAFGTGPTSWDPIFRNSIAYKTCIGVLNFSRGLETGKVAARRADVMQAALQESTGGTRDFLERMDRSARGLHLAFEGDIQEETWRFVLPRMETLHANLPRLPLFQPAVPMLIVDAAASEMFRSPEAEEYARAVAGHVSRTWAGYRAAFLVPRMSYFHPDDLILLLEADPNRLPTVEQIRDLCRRHRAAASGLKQRVALFLLLPEAAYQLEIVSNVELWHHLLCPATNPEVFALLSRPEFVLDGAPRPERPLHWTRFANDLVNQELGTRRAAFANLSGIPAEMAPLDVLRNLWRHVQLEMIERSAAGGCAVLPLTPAAAGRMLERAGLPAAPVLAQLQEQYSAALNGAAVDIQPLIPAFMGLFANRQ